MSIYLGILSTGEKRSVTKKILFVFGLSISFIILGFGAGAIGSILI